MPRHLLEHMIVAHTESSLPTINHCWRAFSNPAAVGTPKKHKHKISSTETKTSSSDDTVKAVRYKAPIDRAKQIERHADVQDEDTKRLAHGWRQEIGIADKHGSYQTRFLDMFLEFQHIRDGRLGRTNTAKHRIKSIDLSTLPVRSVPNRAGPKTRKFDKAEIDETLNKNIIEPTKTEWAPPIVFAFTKGDTLRLCVVNRKLNAVAKRDPYPIPRMDEGIDSLG